jgi:hypothetical protein
MLLSVLTLARLTYRSSVKCGFDSAILATLLQRTQLCKLVKLTSVKQVCYSQNLKIEIRLRTPGALLNFFQKKFGFISSLS